MLEKDIVRKIIKYINDNNVFDGYAWKNHGGLYGVKGLPDIMAVIKYGKKSFFLCFEVKQPGNKATEIQKSTLSKLNKLGATANVVTSVQEVKLIINRLLKNEDR